MWKSGLCWCSEDPQWWKTSIKKKQKWSEKVHWLSLLLALSLWKADDCVLLCCLRSRWLCWELGDEYSSKKLQQTLSFWCAIYFKEFPIHMPSSSVISGWFYWKQCQLLPHSLSQETATEGMLIRQPWCAAGVESILGFYSVHWHLVQWEGSKLLSDSKFSLLCSQNGASLAEYTISPGKFIRCQIGGAAATVTLHFLKMTFQRSL